MLETVDVLKNAQRIVFRIPNETVTVIVNSRATKTNNCVVTSIPLNLMRK